MRGAARPSGEAPTPISHPNHRWRGGAVVPQGAVGPELDADRQARARVLLGQAAGAVSQAWNGHRSRTYRGDHPRPPLLPANRLSLADVEPTGPGATAEGRRLPADYWFVWDGEPGTAGTPPGAP